VTDSYTEDGGYVPERVSMVREREESESDRLFGLHRGFIIRPVYPDEPDNVTGKLEYEATILGQRHIGVQDMTLGGGLFNNGWRVRKGTESVHPDAFTHSPQQSAQPEEFKDGEAVFVLFIGGDQEMPVIVGSADHPRAIENDERPQPSSADGLVLDFEFNGIQFKVDDESNLTIKHLGKKDPALATGAAVSGAPLAPGAVVNPDAITPNQSQIEFKGNGDLSLNINDSLLRMDFIKADSKATLTGGTGTAFTFDALADEFVFGTVAGALVKASATFVELEGTTAKLKLDAGKVALGGPAGELMAELDKLLAELDKLLTELGTILTNIQLITVPTGVGPSGVPNNAAAFATSATAIAAIQVAVAAIKVVISALKGSL
jgi:hypothetical protein